MRRGDAGGDDYRREGEGMKIAMRMAMAGFAGLLIFAAVFGMIYTTQYFRVSIYLVAGILILYQAINERKA